MNSIKSILFLLLLFLQTLLVGQDVTYAFENPEITAVGPFGSYEVDIVASSTAAFKLGSGQIYINYNTAAFGPSVFANSNVEITTTATVLAQTSGPFGLYTSFVTADNIPSRLSFSWQQALSSGCMSDNILNSTSVIFHLRLDFISGGSALPPGVCFESASPFDDQTFTACGPDGSCTFPDCAASAGIQITNDTYDCSGSALPVSLVRFEAQKTKQQEVLLEWTSEQELNSHYYLLERSEDARHWQAIQWVEAAQLSSVEKHYDYLDQEAAEISASTLYYRLKMVDLDESFAYSTIRAVEFEGKKNQELKVYPVPAIEGVHIDFLAGAEKPRQLKLLDSRGRVVEQRRLDQESAHYYLAFEEQLSQGVYWLIVEWESGEVMKKAVMVGR